MKKIIEPEGITFDDVLLVPARSDVVPSEVDTRTRFSRGVKLNIPIASAPMDTVTESALAIALAQEGGLGVIHKNLSIADQANEINKVKRSSSGVILNPICLPPTETVARAKSIMAERNISGIPIVETSGPGRKNEKKLVGILTIRDLRFQKDASKKIREVMTKPPLVTAPLGTTLEKAKDILQKNRVEKLLLVDKHNYLKGLITIKDINKTAQFPNACRDKLARLSVGAAVGVHDLERVAKLVEAEVDVIVVDTAHGYSSNVINTIKELKRQFKIELVAGNIGTAEAARELIKAGVDGLKVGIGPGSICTTRVIAGVGVPQISAVMDCAREAERAKIPVIADGGIRQSGDISKALAAGADCIMIGGLFAGVAESPGETFLHQGRSYKAYRGMGSPGAMVKGSKERYGQNKVQTKEKLVPEGIEGMVPAKGPLNEFVYQLVGGLRAAMGYCGTKDIQEFHTKTRFIKISPASLKESHPHDVVITREAPNYWVE